MSLIAFVLKNFVYAFQCSCEAKIKVLEEENELLRERLRVAETNCGKFNILSLTNLLYISAFRDVTPFYKFFTVYQHATIVE